MHRMTEGVLLRRVPILSLEPNVRERLAGLLFRVSEAVDST